MITIHQYTFWLNFSDNSSPNVGPCLNFELDVLCIPLTSETEFLLLPIKPLIRIVHCSNTASKTYCVVDRLYFRIFHRILEFPSQYDTKLKIIILYPLSIGRYGNNKLQIENVQRDQTQNY